MENFIGGTPLVRLKRLEKELGLAAALYAKLERANPAGSVKDRAALFMLNDAEARGLLAPGSTIVEPTSGNTGIGLAAVGIPRGYRVVLVMPETMSVERQGLLKAYGAELVLTEGAGGMSAAIAKARQLVAEIPGAYMPSQFENPANAAAHEATTGPEIWRQAEGRVDVFVAGVGTGGTITGTGHYLRRQNPHVHIIAVEPAASPVLSGGKAGPHGLQGIGAGFVPELLDTAVYNEVMTVTEADAYACGRALAQKDGLLVGITSGAALWAAIQAAKAPANAGKHVVVLLPDTGERYLSTPLFAE